MILVTRDAWGARPPRDEPAFLAGTRGTKVHYVGENVSTALIGDHARCVRLVKSIQDHHMDGNGWADIAYNLLVCHHGHVFMGRGAHAQSAANGSGLNRDHYAICGLLGDEGLTLPSTAMRNGLRDGIEWLRQRGNAGLEIKGHRDGYSTSCPGEPLYAWVRAGAPRVEDDMESADVWKYELPAPWDENDPQWQAGTHLRVMHAHIRALEAQVKLLAEDVKTLLERLPAHDQP